MTRSLLLMMKEISKRLKRDNNNTDDDGASSDEDVSSGQGNKEGRTFDCKSNKRGISYITRVS